MLNNPDLLTNLYNAFNPFEPLPADDTRYVDCQDVRGDADILQELGNRMQQANTNTQIDILLIKGLEYLYISMRKGLLAKLLKVNLVI
jgi:hypothetical protein